MLLKIGVLLQKSDVIFSNSLLGKLKKKIKASNKFIIVVAGVVLVVLSLILFNLVEPN